MPAGIPVWSPDLSVSLTPLLRFATLSLGLTETDNYSESRPAQLITLPLADNIRYKTFLARQLFAVCVARLIGS